MVGNMQNHKELSLMNKEGDLSAGILIYLIQGLLMQMYGLGHCHNERRLIMGYCREQAVSFTMKKLK